MTATGNMFNFTIKNNDKHIDKLALTRAKTHEDPDDSWIFPFPTSMLRSSRRLHGKNIKLGSPAGKEWSKKMHTTDSPSQEWKRKHTMAIPKNMGKLPALPPISKCMVITIKIAFQPQLMMQINPS